MTDRVEEEVWKREEDGARCIVDGDIECDLADVAGIVHVVIFESRLRKHIVIIRLPGLQLGIQIN